MIKLENVSKKFNNHKVIDNVSCSFLDQKISVIIGPSGGGKTTLLRCINGLEVVDKGDIYFADEKITNINSRKICNRIGMVFQQFHLFPHMNIIENLIYAPIKVKNVARSTAVEMAVELLESVGLSLVKERMPHKLSGGQKQRVAICRALMMQPKVILFDEPTSALDPESVKKLIGILHQLKLSLTVIIVTHQINFAKEVADKVIFMDKGQVLSTEDAQSFFANPTSHRAQLFLEAFEV